MSDTLRETLKPCPFASKLRKTWEGMIARCYSFGHSHYRDYGGRGIRVCDRWRASLASFAADVGERPSRDHSLDRIDNDGNYEPGNVRWATRTEQHRNKRNNHIITAFGETMPLAAWAERSGLRKQTIRMRLGRGWPAEEAVSAAPSLDPHRRLSEDRRREIIDAAHTARYGHAPAR